MNTLDVESDHELERLTSEPLPGRSRLRPFNRVTIPLLALLLAAAGFLVGIEVEKGHDGGSSSLSASGASARGISQAGARPTGRFGAPTGAPAGGFGGAGAGGGTTGTVSSISGRSVYLKTSSGNTIKVTLTSVTTLKKDQTVTRNAIRPGDSLTVEGVSGAHGSLKASSVSDAGTSSSSSASSSSSSTS